MYVIKKYRSKSIGIGIASIVNNPGANVLFKVFTALSRMSSQYLLTD